MTMQRRPDAEIELDVKDALYSDARLDSQHVDVEVGRGVVYLRGSIPTFFMKGLARVIAERIKDVREVVNELRVEPLVPRTDADITADVVTGLVRDSLVDATKIDVETHEGVVYLRGTVDTRTEKKTAEDVVHGVRGVVDVVNDIRVVRTVRRPDEAIGREARDTLEQNLRLDGQQVQVGARDGVVTLRGRLRTPAQFWLADELVRWIPGVRDVANHLETPPAQEPGDVRPER